jgi:LysM repeat protein
MRHRSPARWLAPLALLGAVAAIMLVISSFDGGSGDAASTVPGITGSTTTTTDATATTPASTSGRRFYVVKDGDVLSAIAEKTGVALEVIEQLNPDVDAQTLHAGQRIKLRP